MSCYLYGPLHTTFVSIRRICRSFCLTCIARVRQCEVKILVQNSSKFGNYNKCNYVSRSGMNVATHWVWTLHYTCLPISIQMITLFDKFVSQPLDKFYFIRRVDFQCYSYTDTKLYNVLSNFTFFITMVGCIYRLPQNSISLYVCAESVIILQQRHRIYNCSTWLVPKYNHINQIAWQLRNNPVIIKYVLVILYYWDIFIRNISIWWKSWVRKSQP